MDVESANYYKFNGLLTYSQGGDGDGFNITSRSYHGTWHSSDQIPNNAVPVVGFFGALNPTDGGHSQRDSLQGEWHRLGAYSTTKITAYGFYYDLNPGNRARTEKNDINACNDEPIEACVTNPNLTAVLPAATDLNKFTDTLVGFYAENKVQWTDKFRSVLAVRGDDAKYIVISLTPTYVSSLSTTPINFAELNSGTASKFQPQPKASLIFGPWSKTEFYAQGGFSFHSNDAPGATQREEPISPDYPFPTSSTSISPLVQTKGGEFGVRTSAVPHLESTLSVWYLRSNSELQQDGDTGGTVASEQSSNRYGLEWANYYAPQEHLAFDVDIADSRAQFTQIDPDDAAYANPGGSQYPVQGAGGKLVPEAVKAVISSGVTVHDYKGFMATMRLRYFGQRDLTSDGIYRSQATALLNGQLGYRIGEAWRVSAEFMNLLNRRDHDIDYAYISQVEPTAAPAFTNVFHPVEPFEVRIGIRGTF